MLLRLSIPILCIGFFMTAGSMGSAAASEAALPDTKTEEKAESEEQVFQVIFPSDTEHVFDFIMDPQKLISQTNAAAYEGCTFEEDGTLFFRRTDGGALEDYSSSSDALVIANRGTADVELVLTASISLDETDGIVMTDDRDFTDDTDASLYLALTDGEHTVAIDSEEGASINTVLQGVSGEGGTCGEYRFWLTGAVNENGDWSEVTGTVPRVTVTWRVAACEEETLEDAVSEEEGGRLQDAESSAENGAEEPKEPEETVPEEPTMENAGQEEPKEPEEPTMENAGQEEPKEPGEPMPEEPTVKNAGQEEAEGPETLSLPQENVRAEQKEEPEMAVPPVENVRREQTEEPDTEASSEENADQEESTE